MFLQSPVNSLSLCMAISLLVRFSISYVLVHIHSISSLAHHGVCTIYTTHSFELAQHGDVIAEIDFVYTRCAACQNLHKNNSPSRTHTALYPQTGNITTVCPLARYMYIHGHQSYKSVTHAFPIKVEVCV